MGRAMPLRCDRGNGGGTAGAGVEHGRPAGARGTRERSRSPRAAGLGGRDQRALVGLRAAPRARRAGALTRSRPVRPRPLLQWPDGRVLACGRPGMSAPARAAARRRDVLGVPIALTALEQALRARHPEMEIAGGHSPPHRALTVAEEDELVERIDGDRPDVVFVGLGAPKQEKWMARMRPRLEAPVLVGVGAAFDFIAGLKRQAPPWMQQRGLEWAFRLSQEPLRLLPRYLRYNPAFVAAFARQYLRERR